MGKLFLFNTTLDLTTLAEELICISLLINDSFVANDPSVESFNVETKTLLVESFNFKL